MTILGPMSQDLAMMTSLSVATPEPSLTRLASPNRNPGDARLILFFI